MKLPRGALNHNLGNIEKSPRNKWQGLAKEQPDSRFATFTSDVWGLRAIAVLLIAYYDRYECDTVAKLIARWAPSHENPTNAYAAHVARYVGVQATDVIDVHQYSVLIGLVKGIVTFENGDPKKYGRPKDWCPQETYDEALRRAGIVPEARKRVTPTDVAQGATAATISVAGAWEAGKGLLAVNSERAQSIGATVLFIAMAISVVAWWRHQRARKAERM